MIHSTSCSVVFTTTYLSVSLSRILAVFASLSVSASLPKLFLIFCFGAFAPAMGHGCTAPCMLMASTHTPVSMKSTKPASSGNGDHEYTTCWRYLLRLATAWPIVMLGYGISQTGQ
ncbi:hypothetical protein F4861DRAFT_491838 [Xylaria intraflava]|nr:hypothetical protein F4861DRAFT_491838 [Xylaria intraflava]